MTQRLDRIVEFSGIGDFIDAPVRTYSSGMVARLGFAVATDVRPEVLIIDEVLAVGDADFQQKSAARIREFRESGSTILVVSHSPTSIKALCNRALWLEHGMIRQMGSVDAIVDQYAPGQPSQ
jgi:ABC-type polysaccharide/polyol phosphate transport system ATPase subunit